MKTAWERVQLSRDKKRPRGHAYIAALFEDFYELHGDRLFADDPAVLGGIATFLGRPVTVISQEKDQNFGMCSPDGYRKALRLMHQAEEIRTSRDLLRGHPGRGLRCGGGGTWPGRGHRRNIYEMSALKVPVLERHHRRGRQRRRAGRQWEMKCGCWKILYIPYFRRRALPAFSGRTARGQSTRQNVCASRRRS